MLVEEINGQHVQWFLYFTWEIFYKIKTIQNKKLADSPTNYSNIN